MKWGLNVKFICYTVFIVVFISLVFSVVFILQSRKALLLEFQKTGHSLVANLARNSEIPLLIENTTALTALAQNLLRQKEVQSVKIFDQSGRVLVSLSKDRRLFPWQKETIIEPVLFSAESSAGITDEMDLFLPEGGPGQDANMRPGQVIGSIEVLFSRESIIRTLNLMRWWIFVAASIAAVIGGIAALYFSRTLIMPMQRLARATYSIARGNWEERLAVQRTDELGQLTESFNIMAESLVSKKEQLENTYRELAQKDRMAEIGKFSMIIAHELKNPLGIIKGSVDILAKSSVKPDIQETMVGYIQDEVKRLNKLIDDFLSFARPMPPQKEPVDVNGLVAKVADHFSIGSMSKQIEMHCDLGTPVTIPLDENQIYQALLNLVNNAVQAIEDEGEIHIATAEDAEWVSISVRDNGVGMPADIREKVFEPFFTTKAKGTGLGLAIVKKIVDNHQGRIEIPDGPGAGTVIIIRLPVQAG